MSTVKIPYLKDLSPDDRKQSVELLINSGCVLPVNSINWPEYSYRPETKVFAGFGDELLWLYYDVKGDSLRVYCRNDQDPVWQDSCVEFFILQPEGYFNFEFNSIGVCLAGFGNNRHGRRPIDHEKLNSIQRWPSLNIDCLPADGAVVDWSLTIAIPLKMLGLEPNVAFKANFYKCGDESKIPHYLSWSPIETSAPDFHRPDFFGQLELSKYTSL